MTLVIRLSGLLITLISVENRIYLFNTNDGLDIEYYDCVLVSSLFYCRRPKEPIDLTRDNRTTDCQGNDGKRHRFSELQSNNTTVSPILHQWKSSLERVEQYSLFLKDTGEADGYLCQCLHRSAFGKNCEYRLPVGETFEGTLDWQLLMRRENPQEMQLYRDVICYQTLDCDSGLLCLDWREICDGIEQCRSGKDEANCDLLEMNRCDDDEYRCMNGMCIPEPFFLDGDLDCLDWSDEMPFKKSESCPGEIASTQCDDHLCPPNLWSCGDGQCIRDRLAFQKRTYDPTCQSSRDQDFLCETHASSILWTKPSGRCSANRRYEALPMTNRSQEELCEYLLKCALSEGGEKGCPCYRDGKCAEQLSQVCLLPLIAYPRGSLVAPYVFFLYNRTREWTRFVPDLILINGTIRYRHLLITVKEVFPFSTHLTAHQMFAEIWYELFQNMSRSTASESEEQWCHRCHDWTPCLSITRINDGWKNCLHGSDELRQTEMQIEKSCAHVRRHRFRCSSEQPTCLSVVALADQNESCENSFDQRWFGSGRKLSEMRCNDREHDECSLLRQYIDQSWTSISMHTNERGAERRISFRSYCDTFWDLTMRDDENLSECHRWWTCAEDQWRCHTGQCIDRAWIGDNEWDCADASDEHDLLTNRTALTLRSASSHNFTNQSYFVPSSCPQSDPFLCLSPEATGPGFSCFNLSQIGDGHIDCAGAFDERNTLRRCSQSSMLGYHYRCPSTNTCIPYYLHCWEGHRCSNRSDDEHWCFRRYRPSSCLGFRDFICFNGQCAKDGRCNRRADCLFAEDEYMCDYPSSFQSILVVHREAKEEYARTTRHTLRLPPYPTKANITELTIHSIVTAQTARDLSRNATGAVPYWCNRGLGILLINDTIVCFCPPQYYGEQCEYHADRLLVLLHLNLSRSISSAEENRRVVHKLLVLFLFQNRTLLSDQFHLRPSSEIHTLQKVMTHFPYPRASSFRQQRSSLLDQHPYSIRIELYQTGVDELPALMALWKYPILFDHLPVFRLAKVLHFNESAHHSSPCNALCQPLLNSTSPCIDSCPTNLTGGKDPSCALGSLCRPNAPRCLCPLNRFGDRCSIEHDACLSNPCLHNGSCLPDTAPDRVICLCPSDYFGSHCQWTRPSVRLSLVANVPYAGAVVQYLQIDFTSFHLVLVDQQVFRTLPQLIEYSDHEQTTLAEIILAKLYSSSADLHLLLLHLDGTSILGRTDISPSNRCSHLRTLSSLPNTSISSLLDFPPIRYHQICVLHPTRLCFRDDQYLCLCTENRTRVECFLYDDQLDRCEHCLNNGRCLKGSSRRSNDFLCLCPECHSGRQCQFNTQSFVVSLDQLFSPDLLSDQRQTTISLLICFSLLLFFFALPMNLCSFVTLRRPSCLRHGVGHYLLWMSAVNQVSLALLAARLIHLTIIMGTSRSSPLVDDLLCKIFGYLLTCFARLSAWLPSFVALERVYTTLFFNKHWFKQPPIARLLMLFTLGLILLSAVYELAFVKSFSNVENTNSAMCLIEYPTTHRAMWIFIDQIVSLSHSLFPLLINLGSTLTITRIVIKNKMNIRWSKNCESLLQ